MPTVPYDRSLYRTGFRPGFTDPFAATQMMAGIFSPEYLHGLGQGGPVFTREGGWALHGLGAIVPDQAVVSYQGTWPLGGKSANDVLSAVAGALAQDGLTVRSMSSDAGFLANSPNIPFIQQLNFNVRLQVQVTNGMGYGDPNDVISIIRHEVYVATGQFPITDSIPTVQAPGSAVPVSTGQPDASSQPPITSDWGSWIQNNALLIGGLVIAAVVLPKVIGR